MAVVGVDLGTLHSKIGVARRGGIDIITNEVSNRQTPSLVSFGAKSRSIGESAKTQETSNFKNTIGSLKRLIGRTVNDPDITEHEAKFLNAKLVDAQGTVGVQVNYQGEQQVFSATQLAAMYLGGLRDIASENIGAPLSSLVIAVPGWYTDIQRRAMLDASSIAGLNCLRLINETTAMALGYGITKSDLPEDPLTPRHVLFIDVGHTSLSASVVAFAKGQLAVKSTAFDRQLGGRDFDYALQMHFAKEFGDKYKIDIMSTPKARFRLAVGCEKLKKVLSANAEAQIAVESIMNDIDVSAMYSREKFEKLIEPLLERISAPLQHAIAEAGLTVDQLDAIELVGGSIRVPAVRQRIQQVFPGKQLSTTLNQDEAVARGATFACAMLSPTFRVRDFSSHDITPYPIKVHWEKTTDDPDDDTELVVFPRLNGVPSTKILSFYRKEPFEVQVAYADPSGLPGGVNPWVGRLTVKGVKPDAKGDHTQVKVKTRLNLHGIMSFEGVYWEEVEEREEPPMEVDGATEPPKKKRYVKKHDLQFIAGYSSLDSSVLEKLREQENQMSASDKLVRDTENRKNALEEYVYDTRGKLDDRYAAFVQPQEKTKLLAALQDAEDWLYTEEGEDATKSAYVSRLDALHSLGDPIASRWREFEDRVKAASSLRDTLNAFMSKAANPPDHIDEKEVQTVVEKCATIQKWLDDGLARQAEKPKNVDPVITAVEMGKKQEEVTYFANPIFNRPRPKPKVVDEARTPKDGAQTPKDGTQTPKSDAPPPPPQAKDEPKGPSEMDVD